MGVMPVPPAIMLTCFAWGGRCSLKKNYQLSDIFLPSLALEQLSCPPSAQKSPSPHTWEVLLAPSHQLCLQLKYHSINACSNVLLGKFTHWRGTQDAASFFHRQEIWDEHLHGKPATVHQHFSGALLSKLGSHLNDKVHVAQVLITGCWSIRPHH